MNASHLPAHKRRQRQGGISMAEVLLGVSVSMAVLLFAGRYMVQWQSDMRAKNVAEQFQSFQQAAAQYYLGNTAGMLAAMADGTGAASYCMVKANVTTGAGGTQSNDTTLHTCAFDANWLVYKGLLPPTFKATNVFGQRLVSIFKRVYDASNAPTQYAEMLVVAAQDTNSVSTPSYGEATAAAEIMGGNGGVVPDKDRATCKSVRSSSTYQVCGAQGTWQVDLSKFISSSQLSTFSSALPN
ncbi:hypothetical protein [Noviherbaspirillum galbum]|uniref:Uncharacterized protein n=1 Tax=Noviherbaspirillum galbum TaxID=2709383 RepID=A0A6B3SRT5_9BURK|nr:hypothetical protein [Noviherbaspirillum galbum]NEX63361.1 hypothetical protein [Noviherbaspirillum galbum]